MKAARRLNVWISADLAQELREFSKESGVRLNKIVENGIREELYYLKNLFAEGEKNAGNNQKTDNES